MDSNRIKQVSPSVARLKYEQNRSNQKKHKKNKQQDKDINSQKNSADNGKVIDDFA